MTLRTNVSVVGSGILALLVSVNVHAADKFQPSAPVKVMPRVSEHTRVTNPSAIIVEVLGRGMIGSISFDQVLNDDMAAGFGFSGVSTNVPNSGINANRTAYMFPAYFNYYFTRAAGSFFGTAGVNLVTNTNRVQRYESSVGDLIFPTNSIIPTFGVGYENRGDNGFIFRATAYGLYGDSLTGWFGASFGYAF